MLRSADLGDDFDWVGLMIGMPEALKKRTCPGTVSVRCAPTAAVTVGRQPARACGTFSSVARSRARSARICGLLLYAPTSASVSVSACAPPAAAVSTRPTAQEDRRWRRIAMSPFDGVSEYEARFLAKTR